MSELVNKSKVCQISILAVLCTSVISDQRQKVEYTIINRQQNKIKMILKNSY